MLAGCWTSTPLDKVVVLIIDGARFDFAAPASELHLTRDFEADVKEPLELAKLRSIGEILEKDGPVTSELFRFVADPPTTTQQRLKGILTGGLPTFVDVSKSFGGAVLSEDNVIAQCAANGRRVAFAGDDTWLELFRATHFAAGATPFPSFNVKDLDTVDNGVRQHVMARLEVPEKWDLLIGHFLGVDHAGHTFGVDSAAMRRKVSENDADVRAVVAAMSSDAGFDKTMLIVMGDHGMTLHGDHGGGSAEETDSFLFAYHPRAAALRRGGASANETSSTSRTAKPLTGAFERMPQIDFAPTVSLLLGVPIPFGNLGTVRRRFWEIAHAREVLNRGAGDGWLDERYLAATQVTAAQVWRYLTRYAAKAGNPFAALDWSFLEDLYGTASDASIDGTNSDLSDFEKAQLFSRFLFTAANLARAQWVQFGTGKMILGLVLRYAAKAGNPFAALDWSFLEDLYGTASDASIDGTNSDLSDFEKAQLFSRFLFTAANLARAQWVQFGTGKMILGLVLLTLTIGVQGFVLYKHWGSPGVAAEPRRNRTNQIKALVVVVSALVAFAGRTSNSFIEAEGSVMHFLFATFAITRLVEALARAHTNAFAWKVKAKSAIGLLACNAALQHLGATWVKEESLDDDSSSSSWVSSSREAGFPPPVLLGALAVMPLICARALKLVDGSRGLRAAVAAALAGVGARALSSGAAVKALAVVTGARAVSTFAADVHAYLPVGVYSACFLASFVFAPGVSHRVPASKTETSQIVASARAAAWSVLPVLVMLFGKRGALWGTLALAQASCLASAVGDDGIDENNEARARFRRAPRSKR